MKKIASFLFGMLFLLLIYSPVNATLITIGTATYNGSEYNLIWENENNGNSVIWLDYTNSADTWYNQVGWASGLNTIGTLTYTIDPVYTVDWGVWRLPSTVDDWKNSEGYNKVDSEMGHLYYIEGITTSSSGLFNNLSGDRYWSETTYSHISIRAWNFIMSNGFQGADDKGAFPFSRLCR